MKKKFLVVAVGAALTLSLGACGGGKEESKSPTTETASGGAAEEIYQKSCASCHGGDLKGQVGPDLTKVGGKYSKEDIENIIKNGRGSMPAGTIQGDDVTTVAQWLSEKK
ncbi:MAG: cytochrome c551 [Ectobacillus sp.]